MEDFREVRRGARELCWTGVPQTDVPTVARARNARNLRCLRPPDHGAAPRQSQMMFSRSSTMTVPITDTRIEPKHPSPLEKKTNIAWLPLRRRERRPRARAHERRVEVLREERGVRAAGHGGERRLPG
jgi:hypothetical protein